MLVPLSNNSWQRQRYYFVHPSSQFATSLRATTLHARLTEVSKLIIALSIERHHHLIRVYAFVQMRG